MQERLETNKSISKWVVFVTIENGWNGLFLFYFLLILMFWV